MAIQLTLLPRVSYRGQEVTAPRLRGLLALLAGDPRTGCSTARLVDELWPETPPENPTKAVQILVSRLRAQLGPDLVTTTTTPAGYRLSLREDQVDASAVLLSAAESARHARAGDHAAAFAHAEAGLALWDGAPGDSAGSSAGDERTFGDPVAALRAERAPIYRALERSRALALARMGQHADAVEPLTALAAERPRDEEVLAELLRSEAATVGPAAALGRYEAYRRLLRDELGADPGADLRAVHRRLLRSDAPAVRHGIPYEPNLLLGRDRDLAAVADLLRTSRVTSIVGPGGLGKTRLAYAVSRRTEHRAGYVVPFAGVATATATATDADVIAEVASVLGVGDSRHPAAPSRLLPAIAAVLGASPALLVLDNCEHVVDGVAELVRALVSMTQDLHILTTSRAPLGLTSESVYLLPELPLSTAVELFAQRARAARPGVELPPETVAEVCSHLDGLPLAVELAAARVRTMPVAEIARRLDDRFALLRGGPRDAPARHQTLHNVVEWSWNLLAPAGQAAMRALAVFPSGFTEEAARQLLGVHDLLPVLEHLVDQSLLKVVDTAAGARFQMLETVREFSAAQREEAGETEHVIGGLLDWAREFGLAHYQAPFATDPFPATIRVRAEQDNLVQALRYALVRSDGSTVAATTAVLAGLWAVDANYARLLWLCGDAGRVLSHYRPEPEFVEVTRAAAGLCTAITLLIEGPRAVRSLVVLRRLPAAAPHTLTGAIAYVLAATPEIAADRAVLRALCDSEQPAVSGVANCLASYVYEQENDPDGALKAARRMLEALGSGGGSWLAVLTHSRLGELCLHAEQGEAARHHLEAALLRLGELGPAGDVIQLRWALVQANLQLGAVEKAEHWLELAAQQQIEDQYGTGAFTIGVRAEVRLARGDVEGGLRLWRRAIDQLAATSSPVFQTVATGLEPWAVEVQAVAVVAHAYHSRLDLVEEIAGRLPEQLASNLANPLANPPSFILEFRLLGVQLLALALVDLQGGASATGARMVALAERFHFLRGYQPTMSSARARQAAEEADRSAYAEAVSVYADLGRDELRAAALALLDQR